MQPLDDARPASGATWPCDPVVMAGLHLVVGLLLVVADLTLGLMGRSKALALLAAYALLVSVSATVQLLASSTRVRSSSARHPYGLGQLELIATTGLSLVVVLAVGGLTAAAMHNLLDHRQRSPQDLALWGAAATLVVCWLLGRQAHRLARSTTSPLVEAHAELLWAHTLAAALVLLSVVLGRAGYLSADVAVAAAEAAHLLWCTCSMLRRSIKGLMDASVEPELVRRISARIHQVHPRARAPQVRAIRRGQDLFISATVDVDGAMPMSQAEQLRRQIARSLGREVLNVKEVLVDFDPTPGAGGAPGDRGRDELRSA